jgi:hypothetical protein
LRKWPFLIGAFGLLALLFVVLLMYRMMNNEEASNALAPLDEATAEEQVILPGPPANTKPSKPSKPDKPPPLNER